MKKNIVKELQYRDFDLDIRLNNVEKEIETIKKNKKKVYCRNCKYGYWFCVVSYEWDDFCGKVEIKKNDGYDESGKREEGYKPHKTSQNRDGLCKNYKRIWYKFWVRQ